ERNTIAAVAGKEHAIGRAAAGARGRTLFEPVRCVDDAGREQDRILVRGLTQASLRAVLAHQRGAGDLGGDDRAWVGAGDPRQPRSATAQREVRRLRARRTRAREKREQSAAGGSAGQSPAGAGRPARAWAATSVLRSRTAMVMGPTPPGTGVIAPQCAMASAVATSPTILDLPSSSAGTRLMPTSMTVAPGLIQLPF